MKTIICVSLLLCVTLAYASALPSEAAGSASQPAVAVSAGVEDDVLEGAEQRWGWGGGRGWGGRGWGGGYGGGRGWGGGYGGGRGWGGGYGGGYGGGWGGRGWGGRGYGWGR